MGLVCWDRESNILLESSWTLANRSSNKSSMKVKALEWIEVMA
jgi:hypothetical protein